jgi:DNA ligase-1
LAFKPLLAPNNDPLKDPDFFKKIRYPLLCSPKFDGIRCIVRGGKCVSRKLIDLPSVYVQAAFGNCEHLDGEVIVGNPTDSDVYNRTQSHVMSDDKFHNDFRFYVFDYADEKLCEMEFYVRLEKADMAIKVFELDDMSGTLHIVDHEYIECYEQLIDYEVSQLALGYEGIMMRDPIGRYKHNRSTFNEGILLKLKRFQDDEAIIIDFEEQLTNTNVDVRDNLGNAKRSTNQENMIPAGTLGMFICDYNGTEIRVAPGSFTHAERQVIWDKREQFRYKTLKFRFMSYGVKDLPRFPRAVGFRDDIDLGDL